jgi:hypothetical protein
MQISAKQYTILFLAICSFILFIVIFKWIDYLTNNKYVTECFTTAPIVEYTSGATSHSVDLPLTTSYSCKNFCGPNARCSITGQQCFADIDCPGCQPYSPPLKRETNCGPPGDNDAGKLTWGQTPNYSPLTSGYGTQETVITSDMNARPAIASFGVNTYMDSFNEEDCRKNKDTFLKAWGQPDGRGICRNHKNKPNGLCKLNQILSGRHYHVHEFLANHF